MTRTALALSPHLDDAVFSCGGTLAMLTQAGWRVVVVTCFTRSMADPQGFALACQLDKGLGPEVDYMAVRRAEDGEALRALGVEPPIHLPLPEAPHRRYGSVKALFEEPLAEDGIVPELRTEIQAQLREHRPKLLFAPQAIGGHVDHVQVVRALATVEHPILWWRDFPYSIRPDVPRRPFADTMAALPVRSVALNPAALDAREAACAAYQSQLGYQFGGRAALRDKLARAGLVEVFNGLPEVDLE